MFLPFSLTGICSGRSCDSIYRSTMYLQPGVNPCCKIHHSHTLLKVLPLFLSVRKSGRMMILVTRCNLDRRWTPTTAETVVQCPVQTVCHKFLTLHRVVFILSVFHIFVIKHLTLLKYLVVLPLHPHPFKVECE